MAARYLLEVTDASAYYFDKTSVHFYIDLEVMYTN